jgi:hypothetical protein
MITRSLACKGINPSCLIPSRSLKRPALNTSQVMRNKCMSQMTCDKSVARGETRWCFGNEGRDASHLGQVGGANPNYCLAA